MSQMLLVVPRIGHRLLFKVCFTINEHKNAIPQSNHSALVISFRIKNQQPKRFALFVYSFVCLFLLDVVFTLVFVLFCCCLFLVCLFVCLLVVKDRDEELDLYGHGAFKSRKIIFFCNPSDFNLTQKIAYIESLWQTFCKMSY